MICRMWAVYFLLLFILDHIISTLCTLILHFLFASWFYLLQVRTLLDRAYTVSKMWNDAPVILCGDFNSTPKVALVFYLSIQVMTMYCIFCAVVLMLILTCYLMFVSFLSCLESALQFCVGAKGSIFFVYNPWALLISYSWNLHEASKLCSWICPALRKILFLDS